MNLRARLLTASEIAVDNCDRELFAEAAAALMEQAEEKAYQAAQIEQLKYRVETMKDRIDELERRGPSGYRASNRFE